MTHIPSPVPPCKETTQLNTVSFLLWLSEEES